MNIWYQVMYHSIMMLDFIFLCQPLLSNFDLGAMKQSWTSSYVDKHTYSLLVFHLPSCMDAYKIVCFVLWCNRLDEESPTHPPLLHFDNNSKMKWPLERGRSSFEKRQLPLFSILSILYVPCSYIHCVHRSYSQIEGFNYVFERETN